MGELENKNASIYGETSAWDDFITTTLWWLCKAVPQVSRYWHFLPCQPHCSAGLHEHFLAMLTNSLLPGCHTWWVESKFFPSHFSGDKGQNEIFESFPSVSPAPSFLNCMVLLLPESFLFQVWQQLPLHEQHPSHCSNCHAAPRPREVWSAKIIWLEEEIPHLLDEDVLCWTSQGLRWSSTSKSLIWGRAASHPWLRG